MARGSDYSRPSDRPLTPLEQATADVMGWSPQEFHYRVQKFNERQAAIAWLVRLTGLTPTEVEATLTRRAKETA